MESLTTLTEQWIRERLQITHPYLGNVRSLSLPGTSAEKIRHLGNGLINFVRLKSLDLSCNALVSAEGIRHLKKLERLNLYHNRIPSLEELQVLYELPALRELDLRDNPLAKTCPNYRQYLLHAVPSLRTLDCCSVRDGERNAAIMEFSDPLAQPKTSCLNRSEDRRCAEHGVFEGMNRRGQSVSANKQAESRTRKSREEESIGFTGQGSSTQEMAKSILRKYGDLPDNAESKVPHMKEPLKVTERPKVSFGPYVEKHMPMPGKQKDFPKHTGHVAKGHFTPNPNQSRHHSFIDIQPPTPPRSGLNLSDPSDPILHPAKLLHSSFNKTEGQDMLQHADRKKRGSYRKPLEMLLNLVDKHWTGERSLHHNNNFLSQAVHILSMMEKDISSREAEVRTLRLEANALSSQVAAQEEEHRAEVRILSAQLEKTRSSVSQVNEQLRTVLEENVDLQKQLIKLEREYLKSMRKNSPVTQIKEAQTEVEELRMEIEGLREKVHRAEKAKGSNTM